jgi:protein O-mannosyl-transferase
MKRFPALDRLCEKRWLIVLALAGITLVTYLPVKHHQFIGYDDSRYVTRNTRVQAGLSWNNIVWAFTTYEVANWHPLAWFSHMLDCDLFGLNPSGHHLTSLVLHLANVGLLFSLLQSMTGSLGRSAFVTALFAVHPLNVESVAWVAERKNPLCTLFWLLTLWAYLRYVRQQDWKRYSLVVVSFALGLLSKPMVVTLPFVMLLLDYWPLARFDMRIDSAKPKLKKGKTKQKSPRQVERKPVGFLIRTVDLVWEKVPLFLLTLVSCAVTFKAQKAGGALVTGESFSLGTRLANAVVAYASYLFKTFWPTHLSVFYPHPGFSLPPWQILLSVFLLGGLTFFIVRGTQRFRYLIVGWLWFLGTLIPVIGLVQVGNQAMADRYAYIPLIGLFVLLVWGASDLTHSLKWHRSWLAGAGGLVLTILLLCTSRQLGYWHDAGRLFAHAVNSTTDNYIAYDALGMVSAERGDLDEAIQYFSTSLEIRPTYANALKNLAGAEHNRGVISASQGKLDEAIRHYRRASELQPQNAEFQYNLGMALYSQGATAEAVQHVTQAVRYQPKHFNAQRDLGSLLAQEGRLEEAVAHYIAAIRLQADPTIYFNLGEVMSQQGRSSQAIQYYTQALKLAPHYAEAQHSLNQLLAKVDTEDPATKAKTR